MGDCYSYGSINGCDSGCTFLWEGDCEAINEVLDSGIIDCSDVQILKEIYTKSNSLKNSTKPEFTSIW